MKSRPSIERAALGGLAVLALHAVLWLLVDLAGAARPGSGDAAGQRAASRVRAGEPAVLHLSWIGEVPPPPATGRGAQVVSQRPPLPPPPAPALPPVPEIAVEPAELRPPAAAAPPMASAQPDRPALALSAPDLSSLAALPTSGAAIRLRLHIAADGAVHEVELLVCAPEDRAFAERLAAVLRGTPHMPARKGGADVASVKEIELAFGGPT